MNVQGEDQKKLDVVSNEVFSSCLRSSGRTGIIASEEEDTPVAVEESYSGNYVVVFDPLDGSSNIDAAVSTGSIFGIYKPTEECLVNVDDEDSAVNCSFKHEKSYKVLLYDYLTLWNLGLNIMFFLGLGLNTTLPFVGSSDYKLQ